MNIKHHLGTVALAIAALPLTTAPAFAHDIVAEAKAWFVDSYAADYISGAEDFFDHYADDVLLVTPDSAKVYDKNTTMIPFLNEEYLDDWSRNGLSHVELVHMEPTVLGPNTVAIAAEWKLLNDKGETVAHCDRPVWNYILNKQDRTWKVIGEVEASC